MLLATALTPITAEPAFADGALPDPIAQFDFDEAPTDGRFVDGDAVASVHGTAAVVPGQDGHGTAASLSEDFWLDVTAEDGAPLLSGHDELTISYDSRPAESGNTGWSVFAAASDAAPSYGEERYVGVLDTASALTVERHHNTDGRDDSGNLSASSLSPGWRHVDLVLDGTGAKLYVDQQLVDVTAQGPALSDVLGDDGILQLGKASWGGGEYFTGLVDNLTIYPEALTSVQLGLPDGSEGAVTVDAIPDESIAQRDADELAIENIDDMRTNFSLPTVGEHGSTISWHIESGEEYATLEEGVNDASITVDVRRPATGADAAPVHLEATLRAGEIALTREFTVSVQPMPVDQAEDEAYIWAFFTGEGVGGEKISLAASRGNDALDWNTLNDGVPLFDSELGEEGLRDPFILRSPDGDKFYLIATDLKIDGREGGFTGAQTHGSLAVEVWESTDLVNWSEQRHVVVSSDYAGNTWAPEAYWDDERGTFVMYWASNLYDTTDPADRTQPNYNRMMYATTDDFITFSEPQVWIDVDRRGQAGAGSIDVTVAEHEGDYYRVYKDEKSMTLRQERSSDLLAPVEGSYPGTTGPADEWVELGTDIGSGQPNGYGGTFTESEGPSLFAANEGDENGYEHYLFADQPNYHGGPNHYIPMATDDLTDASSWQVIGDEMPQSSFPQNSDGGMPRHGTIVPVTRHQYQGVLEAYAPEIAVRSVDAMNATTEVGTTPALPESARLQKANGDAELADVVWDAIPQEAYAQAGTFTVTGVAQDDSRQPVEVTVTVEEGPSEDTVTIEATSRCVLGKSVLVTTVSNPGSEPITGTVTTPYGTRQVTAGADAAVSQTFSTRLSTLPAGEVFIDLDGIETAASFPTATCG